MRVRLFSEVVGLVAVPVAAFFTFVVAVMDSWRWWEVVVFVTLWVWAATALWFGFDAWWQKRKVPNLKKQLPALLPDLEALADGLAKELKGDMPPSTVARNHATMQKVAALLATSQIEAPQIDQPLGNAAQRERLDEWMTFVVNVVAKIRADDYDALPTLCRDVQNAIQERREAMDYDNLLRAYHEAEEG